MRSRKPKAPTACRVCIHQRSYTSIHIVHIYTNMRRLYYCAHTLTAAAAACRHDNMTPTAVIYQKHKGQSQYQYHAASCIYWYWYWRTRYQGTGEVPCYYQTRKQTDYAACALYMQTAVPVSIFFLVVYRHRPRKGTRFLQRVALTAVHLLIHHDHVRTSCSAAAAGREAGGLRSFTATAAYTLRAQRRYRLDLWYA